MTDVLVLRDVRRTFRGTNGDLDILRSVRLHLRKGEIVALVGPSGSGKSSLLHVAGLLEKPDGGTIEIGGVRVDHDDDGILAHLRLRRIGFVFQFHNLLPEFTALENVALPARMAGLSRTEACARAGDLLDRLGLHDRASHLPSRLSGGEQQRVAMARALVNGPDVLFADEPTGNLDDRTGRMVSDILLRRAREDGTAMLIATHDLALAAEADRTVCLQDGLLTGGAARDA